MIETTHLPAGSGRLLLHLHRDGASTTTELTTQTGWSRHRVTGTLSVLRDAGLVEVVGHRGEGRGRPARAHDLLAPLPDLASTLRGLADAAPGRRLRALDALQALRQDLARAT